MAKRSKGGYRSRDSYFSSDPIKRRNQLANLPAYGGRRVKRGESVKVWGGKQPANKYPNDIIGFVESHFYTKENKTEPIKLLGLGAVMLRRIR